MNDASPITPVFNSKLIYVDWEPIGATDTSISLGLIPIPIIGLFFITVFMEYSYIINLCAVLPSRDLITQSENISRSGIEKINMPIAKNVITILCFLFTTYTKRTDIRRASIAARENVNNNDRVPNITTGQ